MSKLEENELTLPDYSIVHVLSYCTHSICPQWNNAPQRAQYKAAKSSGMGYRAHKAAMSYSEDLAGLCLTKLGRYEAEKLIFVIHTVS